MGLKTSHALEHLEASILYQTHRGTINKSRYRFFFVFCFPPSIWSPKKKKKKKSNHVGRAGPKKPKPTVLCFDPTSRVTDTVRHKNAGQSIQERKKKTKEVENGKEKKRQEKQKSYVVCIVVMKIE